MVGLHGTLPLLPNAHPWDGLFNQSFLLYLTPLLIIKIAFHRKTISEKCTGKDKQKSSHEVKVLSPAFAGKTKENHESISQNRSPN
jgi:hypothetical protein